MLFSVLSGKLVRAEDCGSFSFCPGLRSTSAHDPRERERESERVMRGDTFTNEQPDCLILV